MHLGCIKRQRPGEPFVPGHAQPRLVASGVFKFASGAFQDCYRPLMQSRCIGPALHLDAPSIEAADAVEVHRPRHAVLSAPSIEAAEAVEVHLPGAPSGCAVDRGGCRRGASAAPAIARTSIPAMMQPRCIGAGPVLVETPIGTGDAVEVHRPRHAVLSRAGCASAVQDLVSASGAPAGRSRRRFRRRSPAPATGATGTSAGGMKGSSVCSSSPERMIRRSSSSIAGSVSSG
jgi:hypothetical protein